MSWTKCQGMVKRPHLGLSLSRQRRRNRIQELRIVTIITNPAVRPGQIRQLPQS